MKSLNHSKKFCSNPVKRCYCIGTAWVVGIDTEIAKKLKISEHETLLEQQIVEGGILMRVRRLENNYGSS